MNRFAIGDARVGGPELLIVAGPCVVESAEMCLTVASKLKELTAARGLPLFDIMLEAKAADLALLRLRADLRRYTPELAALVW